MMKNIPHRWPTTGDLKRPDGQTKWYQPDAYPRDWEHMSRDVLKTKVHYKDAQGEILTEAEVEHWYSGNQLDKISTVMSEILTERKKINEADLKSILKEKGFWDWTIEEKLEDLITGGYVRKSDGIIELRSL